MEQMTVEDKIVYARCRLIIRYRFFGALLMEFPLEENLNTETMMTDNVKIYYNPNFVKKIHKNHVMTLLLHELQHIVFKHFMRFKIRDIKTAEDKKMVNYALDYAINSVIVNEMSKDDNLIELPKGMLYDEQFKGMNAEKILEILKKEKKDKDEGDRYDEKDGLGQFDDHEGSSQATGDEMANTKKKTGKSNQDQMNDIDKRLYKIASTMDAKERGELPDSLNRMIDEYIEELEGHVDWRRYIKKKLQDIGRGQYTTSKVNRTYLPWGFYLPAQTGSRAKVALALDTSGSITKEDIIEFLVELRHMLRIMPNLEVVLYGCDAEIQGKARINGYKNFRNSYNKVLTGGGGTSYIPVFEDLLQSKDKDIKCLFYFTDGYGDQNEIEKACGVGKWQTFWVVQKENRDVQFPFGKKVIMWKDKNEEDAVVKI
jgi:predicted metal-dependent peptidase